MTGNYIGPPGNAQVPSMPFYPSFVGIMLLLLYGVKIKEEPFFIIYSRRRRRRRGGGGGGGRSGGASVRVSAMAQPSDSESECDTGARFTADLVSADQQYPEMEGYAEFCSRHVGALEALCAIRSSGNDFQTVEQFLRQNLDLLISAEHTGRWFMLRHSEAMASGRSTEMRREARVFFCIDAACHAANQHYLAKNGNAAAHDKAQLRECVQIGLGMLFAVLHNPNHPAKMLENIDRMVSSYLNQIVKRVASLRKAAEAQDQRQEAARLQEREAAAKMDAMAAREEARKARSATLTPMKVLALLGVLVAMFAAVGMGQAR